MSVLTTPQAVAFINAGAGRRVIGPKMLVKLAAAGHVPAMKLGIGWKYSDEALAEWLKTFGTTS